MSALLAALLIACIGDSHTVGPEGTTSYCERTGQTNFGIGGMDTNFWRENIEDTLAGKDWDGYTFLSGTNDSARLIASNVYRNNLLAILREAPGARLITPPYWQILATDDAQRREWKRYRNVYYIDKYARAILRLQPDALDLRVLLRSNDFLADGVHINDRGYAKIAEAIPEPGTLPLLTLGLVALGYASRRTT